MPDDAPHRAPILFIPRLVESVLVADVLFNCRWEFLVAGVKVSRREPDKCPSDRDHDQNRGDGDEQALDDEAKHKKDRRREPAYYSAKLGVR